jgi:hypothetical protein
MKLPGAESARIDSEKIRDYLLSMEHPIGRFKAVFFANLGYARQHWRRLEDDLLEIARSGEAVAGQPTDYGRKFEVRGMLNGPFGRRAAVVTVWIVLNGEDFPRFVTVYPGGER